MAYTVSKSNGQNLMSIGEAVVDTTYGISLIGQNYRNYGQLIANNFVRLLENNANSTQPVNSLAGQLWFDTDSKVLHYFDGSRYRPLASYLAASTEPISPLAGDQWWDTSSNILMVFTGSEWTQVMTTESAQNLIDATLPNKSIILWVATNAIPVGWALCNGLHGTPNMIGKPPGDPLIYIMKMTG